MNPFTLSRPEDFPQYRISASERQYVLERLTAPRKEGGGGSWISVGFYTSIDETIKAWAGEAVRAYDGDLLDAVVVVTEIIRGMREELAALKAEMVEAQVERSLRDV